MTRRAVGVVLLLMALALGACGGKDKKPDEPPPDAHALLAAGAAEVENATSFELEIGVDGYPVEISAQRVELPEGVSLEFKRAHGVYQAPDRVNARIEISVGAVSTTAELIAVGHEQYYNADFITSGHWVNSDLIAGFSPEALMSTETGLPAALSSITDLALAGKTDLDGVPMFRLTGTIQAGAVHALTFGLIRSSEGQLSIEVYIGVSDRRIAQITFHEPPPANEPDAEPTTWTINISNYNEDVSITAPDMTGGE